jgi:hypothetical protein
MTAANLHDMPGLQQVLLQYTAILATRTLITEREQ